MSSFENRPSARCLHSSIDALLGEQARRALACFEAQLGVEQRDRMYGSHEETKALRFVGVHLKKQACRDAKESFARFELDPLTGEILVVISEELTGERKLRMSPEEVEASLKALEESDEDESSLNSFFIDFPIS